jgi:hypothetical protein
MPLTDYQRLCGAGGTNFPFGTPADFAQYRRSAGGQSDFALALNFFSNWLSIVSMPLPAGLDTADQWSSEARSLVAEAKTKGYRVSALMLPALNTTMERAVDGMAQSRVAQVALAVERFRVAGSSLPDSLAQLVPKYLPAVPEDPYDGKPVRYNKLSPKGYVVYSVGRNRRDDGGATRPMGGQADGPYDLVFAVRR